MCSPTAGCASAWGAAFSAREFAPFRGIRMDESRERFDEAAAMIVEALRTGFIEGDGPHYPQPRGGNPAPA